MIFSVNTKWLFILVMTCLVACQTSQNYSDDPGTIAKGEQLFEAQCSSCHNFQRSGIGPALGGVTTDTSARWLREFISNPGRMVDRGDQRVARLNKKYRSVMPSFEHLGSDEVDAILAFMNTQLEKPVQMTSGDFGTPVVDPIPDSVPMSNMVLDLRQVAVAPATSDKPPLARINKMIPMPGGSGRLFISDLNGVLYEMKNGQLLPFLTIKDYFDHFINTPGLGTGFGSFAFHPEFQKNGLFYTSHTEDTESSAPADFTFNDTIPRTVRWVLTEWKMADPKNTKFSGTHRELMRVDMVTGIHGMQEIAFNTFSKKRDEDYGLLYVTIGDGGATGAGFPFIVHSKQTVWGNILRIDPSGKNSANGHYGIPPSNPWVGERNQGILGEIYALGFRNPNRIFWDKSGRMFASNIGQHEIEELDLVEKGHDYGWPDREGTFMIDKEGDIDKVYPLPDNDASAGYTYPVLQFDHDVASAISSGYFYYGKKVPQLQGKYLFGGITRGEVFIVEASSLHLGAQAPFYEVHVRLEDGPITTIGQWIGDHKRVDLRFGYDKQGELYILTKYDGKIYEIVDSDEL